MTAQSHSLRITCEIFSELSKLECGLMGSHCAVKISGLGYSTETVHWGPIHNEPLLFVKGIIGFACMDTTELGFDPTICWKPEGEAASIVYDATIHHSITFFDDMALPLLRRKLRIPRNVSRSMLWHRWRDVFRSIAKEQPFLHENMQSTGPKSHAMGSCSQRAMARSENGHRGDNFPHLEFRAGRYRITSVSFPSEYGPSFHLGSALH